MTVIKTILTVPDPFYWLKQLTSSIEGSKRDIERDRNIERDIETVLYLKIINFYLKKRIRSLNYEFKNILSKKIFYGLYVSKFL